MAIGIPFTDSRGGIDEEPLAAGDEQGPVNMLTEAPVSTKYFMLER